MPYTIKAECPCCGKIAVGVDKIEELFGWRTPNDKTIPQSYCRKCRSAHCKAGQPCKVKD
ncbi:MAG: hypothetical protein K2K89_10860 [Ruminococcus sp.]|nr:hypothetical protein [Ruminococcus sp.]